MSEVQAIREKRKEAEDMSYPYKPTVHSKIPKSTYASGLCLADMMDAAKKGEGKKEEDKKAPRPDSPAGRGHKRSEMLYLMHQARMVKIQKQQERKAE